MDKAAYQRLKTLVLSDHFHHIAELTDAISMRALQRDMHMGYQALVRRFEDPRNFTVGDLEALAILIDVEPEILFRLARKKIEKRPKK